MAKAGFTRSGKSLKSVRRYYALLNQQKAKAQDDDKLSKRVALELKTQQDANEKRSRREVSQPLLLGSELPTERSELPPLLVSPKETGPVFIAPPAAPPESTQLQESTKSAGGGPPFKSVKSLKSVRSLGALPGVPSGMCGDRCLYFTLGLLIGIIIGILGYFTASRIFSGNTNSNVTPRPVPLITTLRPYPG